MDKAKEWPVLLKDDEGLLEEIQSTMTNRVKGDLYSSDGTFAEGLSSLPPGLRAMAATHWLDISLTLDSITWHFGNFGESALVAQTEEGLRELAQVFNQAKTLMAPLIDQRSPEQPPDEVLDAAGLGERGEELDGKSWDLHELANGKSAIYDAWVRYARKHPDRVFGV